VVVVVLIAVECLDNGVQYNGSHNAGRQQVEQNKGECADEQPDYPVFVMVKVKRLGCCVSTASPCTPSSCSLRLRKPQEQVRGEGVL
jgi:hypothetical protein